MMTLSGCLLIFAGACWSHADVVDEHLLAHFAVGTKPIVAGEWRDMTDQVVASVPDEVSIAQRGQAEYLALSGDQKIIVKPVSSSGGALKQMFSVSAWVSVDGPTRSGGIAGQFEGHAENGRGWQLGCDQNRWTFALSTGEGETDSPRPTYLRSTSEIEPHRWYFIVGTFDGLVMRLFVNGKLEAESVEESGQVLATSAGEWTIGSWVDGDQASLLQGGLIELKLWDRVVSPQEIMLVAAKNRNLLDAEPAAAAELTFLVEPILQFGTKESMTFVCETSVPTKVDVHYGRHALLGKQVSTNQASLISEVTVSGLEPFHEYFYRVDATDANGRKISSKLRSFQTSPSADQAWAFGVIGDTQRNPEVTRRCAEGIFACRPNFMLHCGDVVDDGFAKNQWIKDLFEPCKELMAYVPTFPVIGNHEKDSHWYYDYFALPKPEHRYTFEYGNAEFFMVDSNRPLKPGSEQYQWLEKELSESKATWKIAAHHHPCFSSDEDDYGDHVRGRPLGNFGFGHPNAKHAIALYEKYGVDVVFNGHIHVYERTWPIFEMAVNLKKGVRYITSGGGGGHLESPSPQRTWFSLHVNKAYHYCHVAVFDRTMVFKAYDIDGRLFDSFEMTKGEDR